MLVFTFSLYKNPCTCHQRFTKHLLNSYGVPGFHQGGRWVETRLPHSYTTESWCLGGEWTLDNH